ncbi:MAG: ATP-dependent zinc metalloprotease FtsH, partial [Opitutales bacterium]|nr:ATP-dependent zinc metalloprotease FtsH [Opitutales bacterium]
MDNNKRNLKGQTKTLLVWAALIAIVVALQFLSPSAEAQKFNIQQLMNAANNDDIKKISIKYNPDAGKDWYSIKGSVKNPRFNKPDAPKDTPREIPFYFNGQIAPERYKILTDRAAAWTVDEESSYSIWKSPLFSFLPLLVFFGIGGYIIMRKLGMSNKSAMNFGKSRARLLPPDKDRTTFDDVAGCDEAKEEVAEIVDFLKSPDKFRNIGAKIPKGVLMVGPPGTGKTLLARAIAGEANVPFYSISGSDFVEMFVGVGASRVRDMFEQARKNAPCLVFIDEIDAVGRLRGAGMGGGNDEREQTLNSLLVEMDGFDGREGIIIIAATNRPDVLDNALLRPGRFDRQVTIDYPDIKGREEILKIHAKKIKTDKDMDFALIAKISPMCAGADLANMLNEAAINAARRGAKSVSMADVEEARDKIFFGKERKKLMDDEQKRLIACHESGHTLVSCETDYSKRMPVHKVTIIPRNNSLGSTMFLPEKDILLENKTTLLNQICVALGGRAAEEEAIGEISNGAAGDIEQATKIARKMVCNWGMGSLGPIAFGGNQEHIFLGKEIARDQNISEKTAELIDAEIKSIISSQLERARE